MAQQKRITKQQIYNLCSSLNQYNKSYTPVYEYGKVSPSINTICDKFFTMTDNYSRINNWLDESGYSGLKTIGEHVLNFYGQQKINEFNDMLYDGEYLCHILRLAESNQDECVYHTDTYYTFITSYGRCIRINCYGGSNECNISQWSPFNKQVTYRVLTDGVIELIKCLRIECGDIEDIMRDILSFYFAL